MDAPGFAARPTANLPQGLVFWRVFSSLDGIVGTQSSPVWQIRVPVRSAALDVDTSWGTALDLNGDGFGDVAVGAPQADSGAGRVYVFQGSAAGVPTAPVVLLAPPDSGGQFGRYVSSAGDVDGDGRVELLVQSMGGTYVYASSSDTLDFGEPFATFSLLLRGAGDIHADGYADLVAGVTGDGCHLLQGGPSGFSEATFSIIDGDDQCSSATGIGDVDGDGYGDIAGIATDRVGVVRGSAAGIARTGGRRISFMSTAINPIPADYDGDGRADIAISSISGNMVVFSNWPDGFSDSSGQNIAAVAWTSLSDLDRDGFDDIAVRTFDGMFSVRFGAASGMFARTEQVGVPVDAGVSFGLSSAGVGDVDHNGYPDLAVGAADATGGGRVFLYLNQASGLTATPSSTLDAGDGMGFGHTVAN